MKRFWWSWVLVFVLGICVGSAVRKQERQPGTQPPAFLEPTVRLETPTLPEETPPATQQIPVQQGLPCRMQYTSLVARHLVCYDGPYLEDGSQEELTGVCGLLLENTANVGVEYVRVIISQGNQELVFDATYIPPKGSVMILEKNRTAYSLDPVESCSCRTLIPGDYDWEKDQVQIQPGEGFGMVVTNLTDRVLPYVRIFYKQHDAREDLHIGGITYSAVLPDLMPGESRDITPYRYANGHSAVVAVVIDP